MGKGKHRTQDPNVFQVSIYDYLAYLDSVEEDQRIVMDPDEVQGPERWDWSESELKMLHLGLLEDSLTKLKSEKTSASTKKEILLWINKPLQAEAEVFTFQACCILAGLNADELRDQLRFILKRTGQLQ